MTHRIPHGLFAAFALLLVIQHGDAQSPNAPSDSKPGDGTVPKISESTSPNEKRSVQKADGLRGIPIDKGSGIRFTFRIDPATPLADLLPAQPQTVERLPRWSNDDLAKVPELAFGEPISKDLAKKEALEATAYVMAKINHLNLKKRDGFMIALIEKRGDLRGLPVLMNEKCRTSGDQAKAFGSVANLTRQSLATAKAKGEDFDTRRRFWSDVWCDGVRGTEERNQDAVLVAALTQILISESGHFQVGLAKHLAMLNHIDATKAMAKLALFSSDEDARDAAIEGLKRRPKKDYTDILLQGFRYPFPAVSKNAADALVALGRNDQLGNLIEVLESPDPRLPVTKNGVTTVRELVRVNHHRNCLLCHAPGNTADLPEGVLTVAVPLPGEPLPEPAIGGYQSTPPPSPDIVVRLDMTYLRQDFSLMMPVADAHPWPEMQRFDFLVRTREITPAEAKAYVEDKEPGRLSPYHRAALYALRELTGRDTEPTAAAWRKLLNVNK